VHTFGQDQVDDFYPGCLRTVWSMALEPDGKVLVVAGSASEQKRACSDECRRTLDTAFRSVVTGRGIPQTTVYSFLCAAGRKDRDSRLIYFSEWAVAHNVADQCGWNAR